MRFYAGIIICLVGIAAIAYSLHAMQRIKEAKGDVSTIKGFLPGESKRYVGGALDRKASQYDDEVRYLFIGGIIFTVAGAVIAIYYRKKR
jgi:hypothetical protein